MTGIMTYFPYYNTSLLIQEPLSFVPVNWPPEAGVGVGEQRMLS